MTSKVSINLCCYNSEKYLEETLDTIAAQTYKNWELIIVNDGSEDSTELIITKFIEKGYPVIYHKQSNQGLSSSRNKAISLSTGEYIAFIDHDDTWCCDKLEKQINRMEQNLSIGFLHTNYEKFNVHRRKISFKKIQPEDDTVSCFLFYYDVGLSTTLIRRACLENLDHYFDPALMIIEEYDFFLRILSQWKGGYIHEVLAGYRIHEKSNTILHWDRLVKELEYVSIKLKKYFFPFDNRYKKGFQRLFARIDYDKALLLFASGNKYEARALIKKHLRNWSKIWVAYAGTFLPYKFYNILIHSYKSKVHLWPSQSKN